MRSKNEVRNRSDDVVQSRFDENLYCFKGYPGTVLFERLHYLGRPIDLDPLDELVKKSDPAAKFYYVFANGSFRIISLDELLQLTSGGWIGPLSLISPYENLEWVLVAHYEHYFFDGGSLFKIVFTDELSSCSSKAIARLLSIAEFGGAGTPLVEQHDL